MVANTIGNQSFGLQRPHAEALSHRNGGFLIAGQDWCFGPTGASSISWNITTCRQKFHERGRLMIAIDAERKQLAEVG